MEPAPFDLYGDLEDAYDEAERNGDVEIMETLDTFRIWSERPRTERGFSLHTILLAIHGNVMAQDDVGYVFFRYEDNADDKQEGYEWLNKPELAQYWFRLAAEAGNSLSQNSLATLYCPEREPLNVFKLGRFARRWWEASAEQEYTDGMRNLARCLRCGKCCCCDRDIARAEALEAKADQIDAKWKGMWHYGSTSSETRVH
jgi:TPR repeat protein